MRVHLLAILLVACASSPNSNPKHDADDAPPKDSSSPAIDAPTTTGTRVRFIAVGDTGNGTPDQRRVADAMKDVCAARGCDFVLLLGDNIYESGVTSVGDPQWQTKFEQPYSDISLPFYAVLGNHDNGGKLLVDFPGAGNEFERGKIQVDYTAVSTKWKMPATHYTFSSAHVGFIVLDTNAIVWENTTYGDQAAWMAAAKAEVAGKDWTLVVGHHPYRSNGKHGNAGTYEDPALAGIPVLDGKFLKTFFDTHVCGLGQVYLSGHDHSRQWLDEPTALCGTQMIVSGAGSETTEIADRGNAAFYEDASKIGFLYVDIDGDSFTGAFYDADGQLDFTRTFTK